MTRSLAVGESTFGEAGAGELQFDAIDRHAGTARMIGNQAAADVAILLSPSALTFIEQTTFGSINVTTVFETQVPHSPTGFIAVHSRHATGMIGPPLPSQYHGTCRVWD